MKSNLLRVFLEWALITSVLMSVGFFVWYWMKSHQVHVVESHIGADNEQFQRMQVVMTSLGRDCDEYGKTNPDLARFLASLNTPPAHAAAANPKSTGTR
jgi:hypothetical protein